jgi:DNA-binding NarL/FixJ family response regulator
VNARARPLRVLIADDHKPTRDDVCRALDGDETFEICAVARVLDRFRGREPRWRRVVSGENIGKRLTSREWEVLELLAQRRSTAEIADRLALSTSAARVHIASIVHKLGVADRAAVVELFLRSRA